MEDPTLVRPHFEQMMKLAHKDPKTLTEKEGMLLKHYHSLLGGGFFSDLIDKLKKRFSSAPRETFSPADDAILKEKGNQKIVEIKIVRTPLHKKIQTIINIGTLGKAKEAYDELFHLFLIIFLEDGTKLLYEKNSTPRLTTEIPPKQDFSKDSKSLVVQIPKDLTLAQFIDNSQKAMGADFWVYDLEKLNCQNFVQRSLQANGLLTEEDQKFIVQDVSELSKSTHPILKSIFRKATDLDAWFRKITGRGLENRNGRFRKVKTTTKLTKAQKKLLPEKIKANIKEGYPQKQAVAISYSQVKKRGKAKGGDLPDDDPRSKYTVKDIPKLTDKQLADIIHASGRQTTTEIYGKSIPPSATPKSIRKSDEGMARFAILDYPKMSALQKSNIQFKNTKDKAYQDTIDYFEKLGYPVDDIQETELPIDRNPDGSIDPQKSGEREALIFLKEHYMPKPEHKGAFESFLTGFTAPYQIFSSLI